MNTADASPPTAREQVTQLLIDWNKGNKDAVDLVTPIIYSELHKLAESHLRRERHAVTLQPTALVHEAYLRLVAQDLPDWESRSHFFGVASRLMRQILVDHARAKVAEKRGGGRVRVELNDALVYSDAKAGSLVALDDALKALADTDERKARILELRYFGGLSVKETAETLSVSVATIGREARYAEAWLRREMQRSAREPGIA
jgi:RNA polymerase sigma-70 factor (ECF subfamily)